MEDNEHPLLEPFGHVRFVGKSFVVFLGVLAVFELLASFSPAALAARNFIASDWIALPALFALFLALHILYEIIVRDHGLSMERLRSDPKEPRRLASLQKFEQPLPAPANDDPFGSEFEIP
jgi:uncharacterized membrane protein (DUF485 family)